MVRFSSPTTAPRSSIASPTAPEITLFTIGYQGASAEGLLGRLIESGVRTLIDVRAVPFSRRPEFRRDALAKAAAARGIAYVHLGDLGTPKAGREAARAGRRDAFLALSAAQLDGRQGQRALAEAARLAAAQGPACLLCLERDPAQCHRSLVAGRLAEQAGVAIRHLFVDAGSP